MDFQPDRSLVDRCYALALKGYEEGGVPVGSLLARRGEVVGEGHNRRVQSGDPIAHGEMDCLRRAGGSAAIATPSSTPPCRRA